MSRSLASSTLEVYVYGRRVGDIVRDRAGGLRFVADRGWRDGGQRPRLGLAFLGDPSPPVRRGLLPSWFENLLPERGSALREWICRERCLRTNDSAALLRALGGDLPGAVEVRGALETDDEQGSSEPLDGGRLRFSLAGMQLKMSMLRNGDRFALPARGETGLWIVKLPGAAYPALPQVEHATMAWARAAGLDTPECQVLPIGAIEGIEPAQLGQCVSALAVERFDRIGGRRRHQEDFAQVLGLPPGKKYGEGRRAVSYEGLTRLVRDACGEMEQRKLIGAIAFVVASGNADGHLKNWSLQWIEHEPRPRLSPSYDQVATIAWPGRFGWDLRGGPELALPLGRTRRFANLDRQVVASFSARAAAADGVRVFREALERSRAAWPSIADLAPPIMREALDRHWREVPLLRELGGLPA